MCNFAVTSVVILSATTLFLGAVPTHAGIIDDFINDITGGAEEAIDDAINFPDFPSGGAEDSGSCTQSITPATYYEFEMRNNTPDTVYYSINGTEYSLYSGYYHNHRIQRTSGSNDGCGGGSTYSATVDWDYSFADGYQGNSFTLPISNYDSWYEFYLDSYNEIAVR